MKQKVWNIFKAFITGFVVVAVVLWLMQIIAPWFGFDYIIGWKMTFAVEKGATNVIHASWFAPLLVGVIFAVIQLFEDFESAISKCYKNNVKTVETREAITVLWHGFWGLALGFVISMFFLAVIAGTNKTYIIPFLFEATAEGSSVQASTSLITIFTLLGLVWGFWKAEHLPKHKKKMKKARKKRR